jgi:uncharacterized repeat protein (TIGR03803 family)
VLYGTTQSGGAACSCGVVYAISPAGSGYAETVIHAFAAGADGNQSDSALTVDSNGVLYGSTIFGGGGYSYGECSSGCGTLFALTPSASGYSERVIHSFAPSEGLFPNAAPIVYHGILFGATSEGGNDRKCGGLIVGGCGVVFSMRPSGGAYRVLAIFNGRSDGGHPVAGLLRSGKTFYGVTSVGGASHHGTAFKFTL